MDHEGGGEGHGIGIFEIIILLVFLLPFLVHYAPGLLPQSIDAVFLFLYKIILMVLPFAGTLFLGYVAFKMWVHYIRQDFISGIEFVLLEIIPPRDVERSPKAMELFFTNALYHWSNKGGKEEYWQGAVWFWFSLEIASIDGQVHFYIRTPSRIKGLIETQMYAQYPQAQVKEVEDYTMAVDNVMEDGAWKAWGCEFKLLKSEVFPIKTYVDFGLDKDPDEEFKVDPISPVIELFGSLQKGEQAWVQIVVTPSKKKFYLKKNKDLRWFAYHKSHDWVEESRIQIEKMLRPFTREHPRADGSIALEIRAPSYLDPVVKAVSAKVTKLGFETGIRLIYVAKKEAFNMSNRRNVRLIFRQYAKPDCNELWRFNNAQADSLGSSIMSLSPHQVAILAQRAVHEYQERSFYHVPLRHHLFNEHTFFLKSHWTRAPYMLIVKKFFLPYFHHETYVLNVEELATLWHFPGQILKVPTLERIESKEASPPTNLPT